MVKYMPWGTALVFSIVVLVGGCANGTNERIAMLEQTNDNLTERLNRCQGELAATRTDREDLAASLERALQDADHLRALLAEVPEPTEPAAPGWTPVAGGAMIAIEGEILFASGRAVLRNEARRTLDRIVSTVQGEYADKNVFVFGHTDDRPIKKSGWKDNWQLSTERALAVTRYLRDHGVSPTRVVACGCGEYRPQVENRSAANRARNRRVEIFAIDPQLLAQ